MCKKTDTEPRPKSYKTKEIFPDHKIADFPYHKELKRENKKPRKG